jgi:hypothetical protein
MTAMRIIPVIFILGGFFSLYIWFAVDLRRARSDHPQYFFMSTRPLCSQMRSSPVQKEENLKFENIYQFP